MTREDLMLYALYLQSRGQPIPPALRAALAPETPSAGRVISGIAGNIGTNYVKNKATQAGANALTSALGIGNVPAAGIAAGLAVGKEQLDGGRKFFKGKELDTKEKLALVPVTFGLSLFSDPLQKAFGLGSKKRFQEEAKRMNKLAEKGVVTHAGGKVPVPSKGRSVAELVKIEEDKIRRGEYGNPKFARSRDEKDLNPEDIWGYSTFYETDPEWLTGYTEQQRRDVAKKMLDEGLVSEGRGQISFKNKDRVKEIMSKVRSGETEDMAKSRTSRVGQIELDPNNEFDQKLLELLPALNLSGGLMSPEVQESLKAVGAATALNTKERKQSSGGETTKAAEAVQSLFPKVMEPMPQAAPAQPAKQLPSAMANVQSAVAAMPSVQAALQEGQAIPKREQKPSMQRDLIMSMFSGRSPMSRFGGMV